ncbi:MAG TPA: 30S ribosomal protein S4 [Halanaerobiaceae bacterium]|jgi:small subunit ribosomal protein S4|nr:30S ribosomal protein S4 [Bacillota bacterium]HHU92630.1 30S ribosomal protein S4 [Halanaerobiaceae bacterium]
MARYRGSVCKICRREGEKLYLKGERCYTDKCPIERRPYGPGQHGKDRRGKQSEYGLQLREKQKVKSIYGVLERQNRRYFKIATKMPGIAGENYLQLLERRLDNVVYRLGFATSRSEARQLVLHGHIQVNGRKVNIPSYLVDVEETISVKEASRKLPKFKDIFEVNADLKVPEWLSVDMEKAEGKVLALPTRDDIDYPVEENLIVEFYSR